MIYTLSIKYLYYPVYYLCHNIILKWLGRTRANPPKRALHVRLPRGAVRARFPVDAFFIITYYDCVVNFTHGWFLWLISIENYKNNVI